MGFYGDGVSSLDTGQILNVFVAFWAELPRFWSDPGTSFSLDFDLKPVLVGTEPFVACFCYL